MSSLGARLWPFAPWALLGTMLSGLGVMAFIAAGDPGFAVEKNYYSKAVAYDREIEQRAENARLGWSVTSELGLAERGGEAELRVRLASDAGPVKGARASVEALRIASAAEVFDAGLVETAPGEYRASFPVRRGGLWELRLRFERGRERFTRVERVDVEEAR